LTSLPADRRAPLGPDPGPVPDPGPGPGPGPGPDLGPGGGLGPNSLSGPRNWLLDLGGAVYFTIDSIRCVRCVCFCFVRCVCFCFVRCVLASSGGRSGRSGS
jgi:hypothetical protein